MAKHHTEWADQRLPDIYDKLDEIADGYPRDSRERSDLLTAMRWIESADWHVEKRAQEDREDAA